MAYKVFNNGNPLPASDLNTFLMNQSVITFVSSTERDAVLTSPTEGMLTYLQDDNKLYLYTGSSWVVQNPITTEGDLIVGGSAGVPTRLAVGVEDYVLTSNGSTVEWVAPSTGGLAELATGSMTGATVSITSITGAYNSLILDLFNVTSSDGALIRATFNSDTGSNYSENFTNSNFFSLNREGTVSVGAVRSSRAQIFHYKDTDDFAMILSSPMVAIGTTYRASNRGDGYKKSAAITSIQIFTSTGSSFTGGTYRLLGVS